METKKILSFATVNCHSKTDTLEHVLSAVFSLNFSSAGKRPFLTGKAGQPIFIIKDLLLYEVGSRPFSLQTDSLNL